MHFNFLVLHTDALGSDICNRCKQFVLPVVVDFKFNCML